MRSVQQQHFYSESKGCLGANDNFSKLNVGKCEVIAFLNDRSATSVECSIDGELVSVASSRPVENIIKQGVSSSLAEWERES